MEKVDGEGTTMEEKENIIVAGTGSIRYPPPETEYQQLLHNANLFLSKLTTFHASFSTNFISPSVKGTSIDLHRLFVEVTNRGGYDQVIRDRKWKEVVSAFKLPMTRLGKSFLLRKYYVAMLYHFEQVYLFRKGAPAVSVSDTVNHVHDTRSIPEAVKGVYKESATMSHMPASAQIQSGVSLVGVIDEKFENGYVVSVNIGSDKLKGILYHIPDKLEPSWSSNPCMHQHRNRKKAHLTLLGSSEPEEARKTYSFSTEHYATPLPMSQGQEECITDKSGHVWNKTLD